MRKRKRGKLKTRSGRKVTRADQAIAMGRAEARERGAKFHRGGVASRHRADMARPLRSQLSARSENKGAER